MKVYIASSHKMGAEITKEIFRRIGNDVNINAFFPEHLGDFTNSIESMSYIDTICCDKIRESDVLVAVYPFGYSVSVEIGRFLEYRETNHEKKQFIILDCSEVGSDGHKLLRTEAMILPHIDYLADSIDDLLAFLYQMVDHVEYC